MAEEKVVVSSYSGYKAEEEPREFLYKGRRIRVSGIVSARTVEGPTRRRRRIFNVSAEDGGTYTLIYDEEAGEWLLET